MMAIFGTILSQAIMAKMFKMAQMAVMEWYNMATNMIVIGVYGKSGKMQITHENGIEKTATVQKLWPNQNIH